MSARSRACRALAGALAAGLALMPMAPRHAAAEGGDFPAASRGTGMLISRGAGPPRGGSASGEADGGPGRRERARVAKAGDVTPEKLERWRSMTPEERDRYRKRYRRWKRLTPERRKRILENRRRWNNLPEEQRRFLMQRREIYRNARPEEKRSIEKFVRRWRRLPPERREAVRRNLSQIRDLPAPLRDGRLMEWPIYHRLTPDERTAVRRFLFAEPSPRPPGGLRGAPRD